jgi:predicted nucleotidyltransferase
MLTKTQLKILELFVSNLTKRFGIREVARILKMNNSLVHRNIIPLIEENVLIKDDKGHLILNFRKNHDILTYVEYERKNKFLNKNKNISLMLNEIIKEFPYGYFVTLIFGSTVTDKKPRDLDLLIIIENTEDIENAEKYLYNIVKNYSLPIHSLIISFESVYEMLSLREEKNVMNEVLNKHLILYGSELFYKLISKGRK